VARYYVNAANMLDPESSLSLAERVAVACSELGFECALIGAAALAVHRYARGTEDVDLAVNVDPLSQLATLERALMAGGLRTRLRLPDEDDSLGGVLAIWSAEDADGSPVDTVDVVNFHNPFNPVRNPGAAAIARARPLDDLAIRCVTLEDLIALKLYAGGLTDRADIVELLVQNPDADIALIRSTAAPFDVDDGLDRLIDAARKQLAENARQL
jgi:hypothetical protein